jgi:hypothetical protein
MEPKFPDVHVDLEGEDGNAFSILGRTRRALLRGGATADELTEFQEEAMGGDYDHLLRTVMEWVETD